MNAKLFGTALAGALLMSGLVSGGASAITIDPLKSDIFTGMQAEFLGGGEVDYDFRFQIRARGLLEDPSKVSMVAEVPLGYGTVEEFVVLIENNPIPVAARIHPQERINGIGLNIRMEMSSPVRIAARTSDGVWRIASTKVELAAGGGGCSSPVVYDNIALGEIKIKQFDRPGGESRMKLKINHPMHTGFAPDLDGNLEPEYYVSNIDISDDNGTIAELDTWAALSSDPVITLDLPSRRQNIRVRADDSHGLIFQGQEAPAAM